MKFRRSYFVLWLREYTEKYNRWALQSGHRKSSSSPSSTAYNVTWPVAPTSASVSLFYARAKQTFFTPNAPYELNISSDVLSPFHTSNFGSHPDPAAFVEVNVEVTKMLKKSLDRMLLGAYANMGSQRRMCGIVGGSCIMLLGSLTPLLLNMLNHRDRCQRLLAVPGMWVGLTCLLSSLHGVRLNHVRQNSR
jgi:hypothetical protein